jgi:hypothetical protein
VLVVIVRNAELNKITIPPNTVMEIQGYCDKETQYRSTSAILHASDLGFEPIDLDVEPRLHLFNFLNSMLDYVGMSYISVTFGEDIAII